MAYILEIDRRRELIATLQLDDTILSNQNEQENEEEETKFNPFQHRDFIIVILEWCCPEALSKLYQCNKFVRSIIAEQKDYIVKIENYKYQSVCSKYETLLKAYKAREDVLLSAHLGIKKAIEREEENQTENYNQFNNLTLASSYLGYRANKARYAFGGVMPETVQEGQGSLNETAPSARNPKPVFNLETNQMERNNTRRSEEDSPLDDTFERQKLANLRALYQHQRRIEEELPTLKERVRRQKKIRKPEKLKKYKSEVDLENNFMRMQQKRHQLIEQRQSELNQKSLRLLKAHEVDLQGIQCMSIMDNKNSSMTDVIDAFCSYKMMRFQKRLENFV